MRYVYLLVSGLAHATLQLYITITQTSFSRIINILRAEFNNNSIMLPSYTYNINDLVSWKYKYTLFYNIVLSPVGYWLKPMVIQYQNLLSKSYFDLITDIVWLKP